MRLVQVMVPPGKRDRIVETLDEQDLDYVVTDETSGREFDAVVYVPLPTNAVEPVLASLRDQGLDRGAYTVVLEAETVVSSHFEELEAEYAEEEDAERIAREELTARAREMSPSLPTFAVMTLVSAVIATAGLLLDSPAVVVGSMVIAPIVGPALAASVGTVIDDDDLFRRGVKLQVLGIAISVASAAAFAFLVRTTYLVPPGLEVTSLPEVRERLLPDFLSLVVALGAGVAGVVSLTSGVSTALVGVMIAVALVPPAATVGIAAAWGLPQIGVGAAVLALVNWLSINLAALATLWYRGYRPERWFRLPEARSDTVSRIVALVAAIAILSLFLGGVTFTSYQAGTFEQEARGAARATLAEPEYEAASLLDLRVTYTDAVLFRSPEEVVVVVGLPPDAAYPGLADALESRIESRTGRSVAVEVRAMTVTRAAVQDSSKGSSGSYPTASTAASSTASTPSPASTLMA